MNPVIKTAEELIEEGLVIPREEGAMFHRYWEGTVALIFPDKMAAVKYIVEILLPQIGREKLKSIWSCLTGPAEEFESSLSKMLGVMPDKGEKWLLFKEEDFKNLIKPAMEKT